MGNEMYLCDTKFHISREKEADAHTALGDDAIDEVEHDGERAGDIREKVQETGRTVGQLTLDELVGCWGWNLIRDIANESDEIIDIDLAEEYSSDEEHLFDILAPFVTAGSFITLSGKQYGNPWEMRYGFTGRRVVDLVAEYPPVPIEVQNEDGNEQS